MSRSRAELASCIALACSIAFSWWGCCSAERTAAVVLIGVGHGLDGGSPTRPEKATIHVSRKEQLIWKAAPGGRLTSISIALAGKQPPFRKCGGAGACVIPCDPDGVCVSGPISETLNPPASGLYYEYTAALAAGGQADPGFIIKP
jgi:hypothetical protein